MVGWRGQMRTEARLRGEVRGRRCVGTPTDLAGRWGAAHRVGHHRAGWWKTAATPRRRRAGK